MRIVRPSIARLGLFVVILIAAAACGSAAGPQQLSTVGSAVGDGQGQGAVGGADPYQEQPAAAAPSGAPSQGDDVGAPIDDAKIIRTGSINLEVSDVTRALVTARDGIRGLGGYVGASRTENIDERPTATITYRVPADRWEEALDLLRGLNGLTSKVVDEQTEAVEVTGAVIDLEARIRNLRASETALQMIATSAVKVTDVLEVQSQLTDVRGQIEQLSAQLGELSDRAAFATLTATFNVPIVAIDVAARGFEPSVVVDEASASLIDILQALTTAGIWFAIVWLPLLLVLGIIVFVVSFIVRRLGLTGRGRRNTPLPGETTV